MLRRRGRDAHRAGGGGAGHPALAALSVDRLSVSQYTSPTPVPGFLDPDDPTLFPRLTAAQIEQLAERAETLSLSPGEVLFEQGQRDTPFYVVLSGAIDIIDRQPDGDHYFTQCQPGTFAADISMFTGEPTLARGVIAEESSILALPPDALRALVASSTELGDLLLRTMITRREWLMGQGYGYELLIGKRSSGDAFAIRELLERNLVPFSWHDIDTDAESKALLDRLGIGADECPVLVRTHSVLRRPTVTQVADELGLRAKVDQRTFDVVVLGAGPAGLATAVYASSEGLSTLVIERFAPGGQAGTSDRIENYLGFPTGLSGSDLTQRATLQAWKFGAVISSAHGGCRFSLSESDGLRPTGARRRSAGARPLRRPRRRCRLSPLAGRRSRALRGPGPLLRRDSPRGPPGLGRRRCRGRRRQLSRTGGGQPGLLRAADLPRRATVAGRDDVSLPHRSHRGRRATLRSGRDAR